MITKNMLVYLYNLGYHAGHNDTVEGCYADILQCDMDSYHRDIVDDILSNKEDYNLCQPQ